MTTEDIDCPEEEVDPPERRRAGDLTIITIVLGQMALMEKRLGEAIKSHSDAETERWNRHEREHAEDTKLLVKFSAHLDQEEREDLVLHARLEPVQKAGGWIRREWRTLVIIGMVIANFVAQLFDRRALL